MLKYLGCLDCYKEWVFNETKNLRKCPNCNSSAVKEIFSLRCEKCQIDFEGEWNDKCPACDGETINI